MNLTVPSGVRQQLDRILASGAFSKAARLRQFLIFLVEKRINEEEHLLKETVLGIEVFRRGAGFDPKTDPIVRVDARRLRARLAVYYQGEGSADPIRIVLEPGSYVPSFEVRPGGEESPRKHSVAVLPFANLSSTPDDSYFCEGLTEQVLNTLAQVRHWVVIVPRLALRPQADQVVRGSMRREGGRVRITVSLTTARDGSVVWSRQYDSDAARIFSTQEAISRDIAAAVGARPQRSPLADAYAVHQLMLGLNAPFYSSAEDIAIAS